MSCSRRDILAAISGIATVPGWLPRALADDPPVLPATWTRVAPPRVPVAAAGVASQPRSITLVGGFTDRLEATAAVQVRDPRHGWSPIGTSLLEPRAEPVVVPIDEEAILVIGGWTGRLPDARVFLPTAEICDPRNPHRRRSTPLPLTSAASLEGARAVRISEGRILLVVDREGTIFDSESESWSPPFPLHARRRDPALLFLGATPDDARDLVLALGGNQANEAAVEEITIPRSGVPTSSAWSDAELPCLFNSSVAEFPAARGVVLAGGLIDGRSTSRTWFLNPRKRTIDQGPTLPIPGGISRASLIARGSRLLVLGGERFEDGRPTPIRHGAVIGPGRSRALAIPPAPDPAVRSAVISTPTDVTVVGGYRFDAAASIGARTRIVQTADRLDLPSLVIAD